MSPLGCLDKVLDLNSDLYKNIWKNYLNFHKKPWPTLGGTNQNLKSVFWLKVINIALNGLPSPREPPGVYLTEIDSKGAFSRTQIAQLLSKWENMAKFGLISGVLWSLELGTSLFKFGTPANFRRPWCIIF